MKRLSVVMILAVILVSFIQLTQPVKADGACTAQQAYDCDSMCFWMAGSNCTMVSTFCSISGGNSVSCSCTIYCPGTGGAENDPGGSGYRHFQIIPDCLDCP